MHHVVFHWSLSDSKSSQFYWTPISILADPYKIVLWMVLVRRLISTSSNHLTKILETVTNSPILIAIAVILLLLLLLLLSFTPLEFFILALADGLSLEFEWQQISWSLRDSSQYSGRSQKCYSLEGLHSSSNFQVHQSLWYYCILCEFFTPTPTDCFSLERQEVHSCL